MPKITAPGVYRNLDIEDYHNQPCDGVSLSSSSLRTLLLECPAKFWAESSLNPDRIERETKAFNFGKAAHAKVLGEPEFNKHFIVSPFDNFNGKLAQLWRDKQKRVVVTAEQFADIEGMVRTVRANPETAGAFQGEGEPEVTMAWRHPSGVWLLSRPDWMPADPSSHYFIEYKTAATVQPRLLHARMFTFGYDIQAALAIAGAEAMGMKPLGIAHVAQEKKKPWLCSMPIFTAEQLAGGAARAEQAIAIFIECYSKHLAGASVFEAWPGYHQGPHFIQTPKYLAAEIEAYDSTDY